jgi:hypothetical protein
MNFRPFSAIAVGRVVDVVGADRDVLDALALVLLQVFLDLPALVVGPR